MNRWMQCRLASLLFTLRHRVRPAGGWRVLMYHSVGGQAIGDSQGIYGIGLEAFAAQIKRLSSWGHFSLGDPGFFFRREKTPSIAVSFDDGYKTILTHAAPLLATVGIPFTVFIPTGWVGNVPTVMDQGEIRELLKFPGANIGSHGVTHHRFTTLSPANLAKELTESRAFLEDLSGKTVDLLSYPFGACNPSVARAAQSAGYRLALTSRFGANTQQNPRMFLRRTDIWGTDSLKIFLQKISGSWDWRGVLGR